MNISEVISAMVNYVRNVEPDCKYSGVEAIEVFKDHMDLYFEDYDTRDVRIHRNGKIEYIDQGYIDPEREF